MSWPDEASDNVRCAPDGLDTGRSAAANSTSSIVVALRKRPKIVPKEDVENDIVRCQSATAVTVYEPRTRLDLTPVIDPSVFSFDHVFSDTDSNMAVYETCCRPLLRNVRDGSGVVIFTFGQTGSGKTYTMLGKDETQGLYGLAVTELLEMTEHNSLTASFFEVYGSKLFDLLNDRMPVKMLQDEYNNVHIVGLTERKVCSVEDVHDLVHSGQLLRAVGVTHANDRSSRSHAVLEMKVTLSNGNTSGRITFVDLAGSERASDTAEMNFKTRQEGAEINKSLLALKECIRAMSLRKRHIPFRGSKLTRILRESFVGRCHTCVIATISPCQSDCEDTLNTLRYADRIKELKRGTNALRPDMPVPCQSCGLPIFVGDRHVCKRQLVPCPHCRQEVDKSEMEAHTMECKERAMRCPHCNDRLFRGELERHNRHCARFPVRCQLCEQLTPRDTMEQHVMHECPASKRKCRFCGMQLPRGALDAHEASCDAMKIACAFCLQFIRKSRMETHRALCPRRPVVRRTTPAVAAVTTTTTPSAPVTSTAPLTSSSASAMDTHRFDGVAAAGSHESGLNHGSALHTAPHNSGRSSTPPRVTVVRRVAAEAAAAAALPVTSMPAVAVSAAVTAPTLSEEADALHMPAAAVRSRTLPERAHSPAPLPHIPIPTSLPAMTTPVSRSLSPHHHRHHRHHSHHDHRHRGGGRAVHSALKTHAVVSTPNTLSVVSSAQQRRHKSSLSHGRKTTAPTRSLTSMARIGGGAAAEPAVESGLLMGGRSHGGGGVGGLGRVNTATGMALPHASASHAVGERERESRRPASSTNGTEGDKEEATAATSAMHDDVVGTVQRGKTDAPSPQPSTAMPPLRTSTSDRTSAANGASSSSTRLHPHPRQDDDPDHSADPPASSRVVDGLASLHTGAATAAAATSAVTGGKHGNQTRTRYPTRISVGAVALLPGGNGLSTADTWAAPKSKNRSPQNSSTDDVLSSFNSLPSESRESVYGTGGGGGTGAGAAARAAVIGGRRLIHGRMGRSRSNTVLRHINNTPGNALGVSPYMQPHVKKNTSSQPPPPPPPPLHGAARGSANRKPDAPPLRAVVRRELVRTPATGTARRSVSEESGGYACPYAKYGCTAKVTKVTSLAHMKEATNAHLDLITNYAERVEQQNAKLRHIVVARGENEAKLLQELAHDDG